MQIKTNHATINECIKNHWFIVEESVRSVHFEMLWNRRRYHMILM